jgi:pimeloyl-ACP methyl ester carboxylesterase
VLGLVPITLSHAQEAKTPPTPNDVFRATEQVDARDGYDSLEKIRLGGIDQWISVRARHRSNPILLFLHGGPGFTSMPEDYFYMKGWDEYFTVVQWDQRGAGKTYLANDPAKIRPTMTIGQMVSDAEELISYLRSKYGQRRIVLMGYSWGSVLGVRIAERHPDWMYVYVGMGQFVDAAYSETLAYKAVLAAARADQNKKAVDQLEAIAPFPDTDHPERTLQAFPLERRWLAYYGGVVADRSELGDDGVVAYSPDYSAADLKARDEGQQFSIAAMLGQIMHVDLRQVNKLNCPVVFMEGRQDLTTSIPEFLEWYKALAAPEKKVIWFNDSAHFIYEEEPGKSLVTLVNDVLPLTRR